MAVIQSVTTNSRFPHFFFFQASQKHYQGPTRVCIMQVQQVPIFSIKIPLDQAMILLSSQKIRSLVWDQQWRWQGLRRGKHGGCRTSPRWRAALPASSSWYTSTRRTGQSGACRGRPPCPSWGTCRCSPGTGLTSSVSSPRNMAPFSGANLFGVCFRLFAMVQRFYVWRG